MDISRRHFLLGSAGAAAGLILPSYYQRALEFTDRTGRPLLEPVSQPTIELTAFVGDWGDLKYNLTVGEPYAGPPPTTLRQFAERYDIDMYECWYLEEGEEPDWDEQIDWWSNDFFFDTWMYRDAPDKLAYELLADLDLGPKFQGENAVGQLNLEHGHTMVSSYWTVEAADEITLSLLQERLTALNTGAKIVMR